MAVGIALGLVVGLFVTTAAPKAEAATEQNFLTVGINYTVSSASQVSSHVRVSNSDMVTVNFVSPDTLNSGDVEVNLFIGSPALNYTGTQYVSIRGGNVRQGANAIYIYGYSWQYQQYLKSKGTSSWITACSDDILYLWIDNSATVNVVFNVTVTHNLLDIKEINDKLNTLNSTIATLNATIRALNDTINGTINNLNETLMNYIYTLQERIYYLQADIINLSVWESSDFSSLQSKITALNDTLQRYNSLLQLMELNYTTLQTLMSSNDSYLMSIISSNYTSLREMILLDYYLLGLEVDNITKQLQNMNVSVENITNLTTIIQGDKYNDTPVWEEISRIKAAPAVIINNTTVVNPITNTTVYKNETKLQQPDGSSALIGATAGVIAGVVTGGAAVAVYDRRMRKRFGGLTA